ncbi:phospholipase [Bacillus megaterium]|nr:phospholipase [Priestia megaterium]NGY85316.1 phospholipase [Priestia megaterium]
MYGHWCGPGCSGPKAPVHPIDSCCKTHDGCYGKRGYFSCYCDRQLRACLYKWVQRQNKVAIMIYKWFLKQPCNPYR